MEYPPAAQTRNFKLIIEYDGTAYHGWQRQTAQQSIQQTIETALAIITDHPITLYGSGRTDAGVHALGQVANFHSRTRLCPQALLNGLNSLLPADITIRAVTTERLDFHARFAAKSKLYRYTLINQPLRPAIGRQYAWWIRRPLNLAAMRSALGPIIGIHDFKAFEAANSRRAHSIREVILADLETDDGGRIFFNVQANGFLRYMVRNLTGTLVSIGMGKMAPEALEHIMLTRDRQKAGITAPPQGLCLMEVFY